jgi:CBS domain-containing protein
MSKKAKDLMTQPVTTCNTSDTVMQAAQLMKRDNIGSVPVVETGNVLVGIVTDRDIAMKVAAAGLNPQECLVGYMMTKDLVTCTPEDNLDTIHDLMSEHQIRRLPVVNDMGQIMGIIAQADLALRSDKDKATEKVIEKISQP